MENEDMLIEKARQGDRDALNTLVAQHWHPLYRFISHKTGQPEDAQELTQESFFRTFRALPSYRQGEASFKTYLHHIALNLIRDYWRKQGRTPHFLELADETILAENTPTPEQAVLLSEQRETLRQIMTQLPADQRQTVELRIIAGLPVREVALALGKSEGAVKMLQQRALKSLKELLAGREMSPASQERR